MTSLLKNRIFTRALVAAVAIGAVAVLGTSNAFALPQASNGGGTAKPKTPAAVIGAAKAAQAAQLRALEGAAKAAQAARAQQHAPTNPAPSGGSSDHIPMVSGGSGSGGSGHTSSGMGTPPRINNLGRPSYWSISTGAADPGCRGADAEKWPVLNVGAVDPNDGCVKQLQRWLNEYKVNGKCSRANIAISGEFGFETQQQLKQFQKIEKLQQTGTTNVQTWRALRADKSASCN